MKKSILLMTALLMLVVCGRAMAFTVELDPLTPLTGYTSMAEWDTDGDFEDWAYNADLIDVQVSGGDFIAKAGGGDPNMGLNIDATNIDVSVQKGLMEIAPFSTTVNSGELNFAGSADFSSEPVLLAIPTAMQIVKDIQINPDTTKKLLSYVNPIFANAVGVSGIINFHCEKLAIPVGSEHKNEIDIIGTIAIEQMHLHSSDLLGRILSVVGIDLGREEITIHPTRFLLQDGILRYDDMQMDVGKHPINFGGAIGLDKTLEMNVTLPYTIEGDVVDTESESSGERIVLPLRGTVDKPELDVGSMIQQQFKDRLKQELEKGLKDLFKNL